MKPLWITFGWIALAALWGCKGPEPEPKAPAAAPAPQTAPAVESAKTPADQAPDLSARRGRSGIDLGVPNHDDSVIDGRKPAARLVAMEKSEVPERLEGDKVVGAGAARAFVIGPWKASVEDSDPSKLQGLLTEDFKGLAAGDGAPTKVGAKGWPEARGGIGVPVVLGGVSVAMVRSRGGDATVRFFERQGDERTCVCRERELTLGLDGDGKLKVRVATMGDTIDCKGRTAGQVAAAHQELVKLWKDEDRVEAASTTPSIWLRDHGLDVRTYDREALHGGEGRWVLEGLSAVTATEENTSMAGAVGRVVGADGTAYAYYWTHDRWTLEGVDRAR